MGETDWARIHSFLRDVESRYRRDRLRSGPKARDLSPSEETEVAAAVEAAVRMYLEEDEVARIEMRAFFGGSSALPPTLWKVFGAALSQLRNSGGEESLLLALGALSLEDGTTDCRDTYLAANEAVSIGRTRFSSAERIQEFVASISSSRMAELFRGADLDMSKW